MLIADNKNPSYNTEYTKFLASLTGGGSIGSTGAIGGAPAAYYWINSLIIGNAV